MPNNPIERKFKPLNIAIMTVTDTRTEANDTSGDTLVKLLTEAGHSLAEKRIIPDDIYQIRAVASQWIADDNINAVITSGGTGITGRDSTPEAVKVLLDKEIAGFGEIFRAMSYEEIGTSTIASRTVSGVANATFIFCLPGSTGACRTGWGRIISHQLDFRTRPCNLVELMPRVLENG
jgi:molybdenum cofactor biosynthesis protein B